MRVLRIARVLKLLKMAKGIRALLNTVMQALPQVTPINYISSSVISHDFYYLASNFKVGNLGLLFFLLFFIFAALGVEMFGSLGRIKTQWTKPLY